MQDRCQITFRRAILRLVSEEATNSVFLEVLPENADQWITCFESNRTALDYTIYSYFTTGGSEARRKAHYIHSIKFYDNEPDEVETDGDEFGGKTQSNEQNTVNNQE